MVRHFLLTCCCLALTWTAAAQQTLNIHTTTPGVISIAFSQKPEVTFPSADVLKVSSETLTVEFPFSEVAKITFEDAADAVESLRQQDGNHRLLIYDLTGKLLHSVSPTRGTADVNLSSFPPGVYVIKDGHRTYKVTRR